MYTYVQTKNWGAIYIQLKANIFSRSSLCLQIRYTTQWSQRRNCWCKSEGRSARFGFHWLNNQHYTVALVSLSLVMVMMTMMVMTDRSRQWWKSNYNDCYHHQPSLGHTASTTGWSRATVFYDFYLTGIKKHQIGKTQTFLWRFYMDILISQKGQVKKFPPFRVVPKLCVFHPDMVQGCLGVSVWVCWCPLTPDAAFMIWGDI